MNMRDNMEKKVSSFHLIGLNDIPPTYITTLHKNMSNPTKPIFMPRKKILLWILFLCSLIGCKDKDIISVSLDMQTGNLPAFDADFLDFPFLFLHEEYGKYYKYKTSIYKNIPEGKNIQYGFRIGQTLNDIELENLKSEKFKISELRSEKEYILLDFWGTWCTPCKKTMPQLKKLNKIYFKSLDIVSIAYDNEVSDVEDYIVKNKLNWKHAYIERKYDASIINRLRIEAFPTFILMDKNKKIILRNSGISALDEISEFLSKKSN